LEDFDFIIEHRAGKHQINAYIMLRLNCEQCEIPHSDPKRKRKLKYLKKIAVNQKFYKK